MVTNAEQELFDRLKGGPAFLFVGQRYATLQAETDSFLAEVLRKYGPDRTTVGDYGALFECRFPTPVDSAFAWMDERSRHLPAPEWLDVVARYPWSGMFTSAIDSRWYPRFRNPTRDVQQICAERYSPAAPRSRTTLHCTFLFGNVGRTEPGERPPLTRREFRARKQVAVALARRIPEYLTPRGTLVIDGYGASDWFPPSELLPILEQLNPGQAHLFGARDLAADSEFRELAADGLITFHEQNLAVTLEAAQTAGAQIVPSDADGGGGEVPSLLLKHELRAVPKPVWRHAIGSANVLDERAIRPPPSLSDDARYSAFRRFLETSSGRPDWDGYARGFAYTRAFERNLRKRVDRELTSSLNSEDAITVHGATGTGKSVSLGHLAYDVARAGVCAVLHIERRGQLPVYDDLEGFCDWAEGAGAAKTLIVWDGMVEQGEYHRLLRYLSGRGRRAVVVGSCYPGAKPDANAVVAPSALNEHERQGLQEHLRGIDPLLQTLVERVEVDTSFLVALYRLLPESRRTIRSGVMAEVGRAEDKLLERLHDAPTSAASGGGALAQALQRAGLIESTSFGSGERTHVVDGERFDDVQMLTGLVMIPGWLGLNVPVEVLLRAVGGAGFSVVAAAMRELDVFEWFEDSSGNVEIGPRSPLEAQLLVQARMGGPRTEAGFLCSALRELGPSERDVRFGAELIRAAGPNGRLGQHFLDQYPLLSETLRDLREERSVTDTGLMLQEVVLLREWARAKSNAGTHPPAELLECLLSAEEACQRAVELALGSNRRRHMNHLLNELATIQATMAQLIFNKLPDARGQGEMYYKRARESVRRARSMDPSTYHPIDVLAWSTREALRSDVLSPVESAEAIADVSHELFSADPADFDAQQRERLLQRRQELASILRSPKLEDDAFAALAELGSSAGYYIRARQMLNAPSSRKDLERSDPGDVLEALTYFEENRSAVNSDARCMDLWLDLWWLRRVKMLVFAHERQALPFSEADWKSLLDVLEAVEQSTPIARPAVVMFLRAIAQFHVGRFEDMSRTFRELGEPGVAHGRRRIVRHYLASTDSGAPRVFHGEVSWVADGGGKAEVYVEGIRRRVPFIPRDFRGAYSQGDSLGDFHIAFNYLGPIADPVDRRK